MCVVRTVFFVGSTCQAMRPSVYRFAPHRMASMSEDVSLREELKSLQATLSRHDHLYYNVVSEEENAIIPDSEYDALRNRERELEQRLGVMDRREVGAKRDGALFVAASPHRPKMLSLSNLKRKKGESEEDAVESWLVKTRKAAKGEALNGIVAEPKLDGLSVSLRYVDGSLSQGATRGDGTQGDDVTENVLVVEGVKDRIVGKGGVFEVRGEVLMRKTAFERLRDELSFTTARNAAAGSLRQINASVTKERGLSFVAHDLVGADFDDQEYESKRIILQDFGFVVPEPFLSVADTSESLASQLTEFHAQLATSRLDYEYEIDGVVYKVQSARARKSSGSTAKAPRWALAHKFEDDAAIAATKLLDVRVSVGKRGTMTPVAVLEPVRLGEVEVKSATLHNAPFLRTALKGLKLGGTVFVRRAGDVIPQIVPAPLSATGSDEMQSEERGDFDDWTAPSECPSCGTTTIDGADGELYCPNSFDCPAQAVERLAHFASRSGVDLGAGLGKKKLEQLVDAKIIRTCADILEMKLDDDAILKSLTSLDGWGLKSSRKLLDAVDRRRQRPVTLATFVFALGVPRIGKTTAAKLAAEAKTWDILWTALTAPADDEDAAALRQQWESTAGIGTASMEGLRTFALDLKERQVAERAASRLTII